MRYLITGVGDPFLTNWFEYENNFIPGMIIYDIISCMYTTNGKDWEPIPEDHL